MCTLEMKEDNSYSYSEIPECHVDQHRSSQEFWGNTQVENKHL